jgi:hypothetical protein
VPWFHWEARESPRTDQRDDGDGRRDQGDERQDGEREQVFAHGHSKMIIPGLPGEGELGATVS